jgi:hypothetical protein
MERNNLFSFANHGIQVNWKRLHVNVVVSCFLLSEMSLLSSPCHCSCFLSLVMDTSQLKRCIHFGTFSGSCGHDDDHSYFDNGNVNGTEYYGTTTMRRRLRKGYERLSRHNQSELFYTSIQEYWLCARTPVSEHCVSSPVKDLPK